MEAYVRRVLEPHAKINLRKAQGLVDLADRYEREDLEATVARALSERIYQLSDFKRLLQNPVVTDEAIPISAETAAFIRSPGYFIH